MFIMSWTRGQLWLGFSTIVSLRGSRSCPELALGNRTGRTCQCCGRQTTFGGAFSLTVFAWWNQGSKGSSVCPWSCSPWCPQGFWNPHDVSNLCNALWQQSACFQCPVCRRNLTKMCLTFRADFLEQFWRERENENQHNGLFTGRHNGVGTQREVHCALQKMMQTTKSASRRRLIPTCISMCFMRPTQPGPQIWLNMFLRGSMSQKQVHSIGHPSNRATIFSKVWPSSATWNT